ncbi:MAG: hypothetical protein K2X87_06705 [Gemmataceae bacterium]|nr:hypothetical protein [Gemmataceae bacterium]
MARGTVACGSCELHWVRPAGVGEFERQAIESRPCPACGAYTLTCPEPKPAPVRGRFARPADDGWAGRPAA